MACGAATSLAHFAVPHVVEVGVFIVRQLDDLSSAV